MYKALIRPVLFRIDPERVHEWATRWLGSHWLTPFLAKNHQPANISKATLATQICGIALAHPVGLAAGFDKDAQLLPHLGRLGFGFVEVGTLTAKPQLGNPRPRLFRLPKDQALINRMGFNNDGVDAAVARLKTSPQSFPVGGNIGKSKITPLEDAQEDYAYSLKALAPWVDYFVVNVSSPNTPNLRKLQEKGRLTELLQFLKSENTSGRPLLLKIAPDLTKAALEDIVDVVETCGIDGVIATNTTISRLALRSEKNRIERCGQGGLSGKPLRTPSLEVLRFLRKNLPESMGLVGVGGIFTGKDAFEKILAGADCVQIYTGLIYRGPKTVALILAELAEALRLNGYRNVREAIGAAVR